MSVTITPDGTATFLTDITRPNFAMNQTVSATATANSPNVAATINVTAELVAPDVEPDLVITDGSSSVNIGGTLQDPFVDVFTYVEQGETDKTMTPVVVERVVNMPADKIYYDLDQDANAYVSRFFLITVRWESGPVGNLVEQTPATFTLELKIYNEWEGIRSFVSNYYT
ncbi:hypothetical protein CPMG_00040 [Prochlorococcus phage MED4-213]|uniref:Uncharacterized protein n=1 Tax=Prochlorococcus phage MED4-213 TaxID=889956 RepID=M4QFN5_9CAUD|nr:toxin [Prochlorococcus phage MED4-213]AGH26141.1 hypothetical protein CPMG_00040 [Prochlorococcus phage MED4-213]